MKGLLAIVIMIFFLAPPVMAEKGLFPAAKVTTASKDIKVNQEDVDALKQRIKEYWDLRIKNTYTKAFDYEDPKTKEEYKIDLEEYLSSKANVKYENVSVKEINFERPDYAKITLLLKYTFEWLEKVSDEKDVPDKWVKRKDGKWYRIFTTNIGQAPLEQ